MEIEQLESEDKGFFKAIESGKEAGRMTYSMAGKAIMIIDETKVNNEFRGESVGKKLVLEAVKVARENNIKIVPLCPFAKSIFDKIEGIRDVL